MTFQGVPALYNSHFRASTVRMFFISLIALIEPLMFVFHCVEICDRPKA